PERATGFGQQFPVLANDESRQLFEVLFQQVTKAEEYARAVRRRRCPPWSEGASRGRTGFIDLFVGSFRHHHDFGRVARIADPAGFQTLGFYPATAQETAADR